MKWAVAVLVSLALNGVALWAWSGFGQREIVTPTILLWVSVVNQPSLPAPSAHPTAPIRTSKLASKLEKTLVNPQPLEPLISKQIEAKTVERAVKPVKLGDSQTQPVQSAIAVVAKDDSSSHATSAQGGAGSAKSSPNRSTPATAAAYLNNPQPEMPYLSRVRGESGEVKLWVKVGAKGEPLKVTVEKSSGFSRLDDAAQKKVAAEWRFEPARRDGVAVEGEVKFSIFFKLVAAP